MSATISTYLRCKIYSIFDNIKNKFDDAIVRCDAWFIVLLAVLLAIAFTLFAAIATWCVVYKGKHFTGNWEWHKWGVSLDVQCI